MLVHVCASLCVFICMCSFPCMHTLREDTNVCWSTPPCIFHLDHRAQFAAQIILYDDVCKIALAHLTFGFIWMYRRVFLQFSRACTRTLRHTYTHTHTHTQMHKKIHIRAYATNTLFKHSNASLHTGSTNAFETDRHMWILTTTCLAVHRHNRHTNKMTESSLSAL